MVKNPPALQETKVQSLGREDPLEKKTAAHSSILAWEIPWTEEAWSVTVHGVRKESDTTEQLNSNNRTSSETRGKAKVAKGAADGTVGGRNSRKIASQAATI